MIEISVQASPVDISGGFVAPVDTDLLYISAACFWVLQTANALNAAGAKMRQIENSDASSLISDTETAINSVLSAISSGFGS